MGEQDRIERVWILPVSRDRAWRAITEPAEIARWMDGIRVEMELRPGAEARFVWGEQVTRARIAAVEPPRRFAYRWHPGSEQHLSVPLDELPLTLVEFILDEVPEGTRLTLIESGFAALPAEMRERALRENTQGWEELIDPLVAYLGAAVEV